MMLLWLPTLFKYLVSPAGVFFLKVAGILIFCLALFLTGENHQRTIDDVATLKARNAALQIANDIAARDLAAARSAAAEASSESAALTNQANDLAAKLAEIERVNNQNGVSKANGPCLAGPNAGQLRGIR